MSRKTYRDDARLGVDWGLSRENYVRMLEAQGGRCAICWREPSELPLAFSVDHDHVTGRIRGLLCLNCNTGVGQLNDDPYLLRRAIDYLTGALEVTESAL